MSIRLQPDAPDTQASATHGDTSHLLDVQGAAKLLGLTAWQIRGLLANGELRCIRVGRKLYMRRTSLLRWAENSESKYKVA